MRALAVALLGAALVGCGAPVPSGTPPASPTPTIMPSPTPLATTSSPPAIAFSCYRDPVPPIVGSPSWLPSSYCTAEEVAVEAAAPPGHTVKSITIVQRSMGCGPFPSGGVRLCVLALTRPWAFVTFADTAMVAALTIALVPGGPMVATLVAFEVPPAGWSIP